MIDIQPKNLEKDIKNIQSPDAIIFDWDDTLAGSGDLITIAFEHTMSVLDIQIDKDELLKKRHDGFGYRSLRDTFPEIFGQKWEEAGRIFYEYYLMHHLDYIEPLLGSEAVLGLLNEAQIPIYIISNKKGMVLRKEVDALNWNKYFQKIVGSMDADIDKPDPSLVHWTLEDNLHPQRHNIWFIGDSIIDIKCANASGCIPLLFGEDININPKIKHFSNDLNYYRVINYHDMHNILIKLIDAKK